MVPLPVASKPWKLGLQVHVPFRKHRPLHTVHCLASTYCCVQAAPQPSQASQQVCFCVLTMAWKKEIFTSGFFSSFSPLLPSSLASRNRKINRQEEHTNHLEVISTKGKLGIFRVAFCPLVNILFPFLSDNAPWNPTFTVDSTGISPINNAIHQLACLPFWNCYSQSEYRILFNHSSATISCSNIFKVKNLMYKLGGLYFIGTATFKHYRYWRVYGKIIIMYLFGIPLLQLFNKRVFA